MTDLRDLSDVKVGDTLYDPGVSQYNNRKTANPRVFHVIKVARQYLYASPNNKNADLKDWNVEKVDRKCGLTSGTGGGWGGFYMYRSKTVYDEIQYRVMLSEKIRKEFGSHSVRVPEIATFQLKDIAKMLGIDTSESEE
ncbi:hypothetical protein CPTMiller_00135 [Citrobacter phage Miller]|uniref:Uncharacterized protein n=1 Tax=Citrobacter phage Miller TaxID=1527524 RepID=A0A076YPE0_9CAUD|nr:hypothetical protein CPTMiller_00135 [Citrobacter phage Miller]AIK68071.1 hypothetical protein CPTMiller_00135 [Citrobacter phage Miller]